jgi:hypothetical protein
MKEHNVIALYETIAKIFSLRENCNISVKVVKQNKK